MAESEVAKQAIKLVKDIDKIIKNAQKLKADVQDLVVKKEPE